MTDVTAALCDPARLREVAGYDILDPRMRQRLDTICRESAARLGQPLAMVTIMLDVAQFIAGGHGLEGWMLAAQGTPAEWAFCAHVVARRAPYLVPDAVADPVHRDNPLVLRDGLRCYAGVPVATPGGHVLGAHCVAGYEPHEYTEDDVARLYARVPDVLDVLQDYRPALAWSTL